MAFCLAELHLWSTKSSLQVRDTDIGTYQYHDKAEPANHQEHHYFNEKVHFTEARGYSWTPANQRPERLRDSLKELEELLQTNTCVHTRWRNTQCCQLLLSSGILVTLTLSGPQLEQVCIDRALVGRLPGDTVTDAVLGDKLFVLSFTKQSEVSAIYYKKIQDSSPKAGRDTDKLSPSTIKVTSVEVAGWAHRLHQGVALNQLEDVALLWWRSSNHDQELWPWTHKNTDANNLVLLSCLPWEGLKVLSSTQTEGDLLLCAFSHFQPYQLLTVEAPAGPQASRESSWAKACMYESTKGRLHRLSATRIPLPSPPVSCSQHPSESVLLLGLSDLSLVLYDQRRGVSLRTSCPAPPTLLTWHPAGALAVAAAGVAEEGELMFLDLGLAPVKVALVAEEVTPSATLRLSRHLRCPGALRGLQWAAGPEEGAEEADTMMLVFHGGLLAALRLQLGGLLSGFRLGPVQLLQQRLHAGQVQEAVSVLEAMDWGSTADQCWQGLSAIANHLLRLPLDARTEEQLEATLATFYSPPTPLPENVTADYRESVHKYARRFFHHLLRYERLEKAFLLAVDLQAKDLFMDLHYVAADKDELVLAEVAKRKARQVAEACDGREKITVINRKDTEDAVRERNRVSASSLGIKSQSPTGPSHSSPRKTTLKQGR
ncbi:WD repeat-containing and planar cell polarity effector protein fritz homolog isoform X1 [Hippocampus zosterae]|uniref:WD repeat-containing and planar cell polarity effector protein fritz homolog isoform X1 n=1 Tax=Hippocampus zosterae TaxID=109293 RepID=UPI00223DDBD5|nr:WD repeat-containing and planar cell polarity effector protein fritz homolog isoform X1 [Hippocampus zosterae]XP_051936139.1 WD repeat-containing and planar cell polarity effector protein fritz homolog isoform X1 [Hippocampus zosterae]XP_051936140.1 WD repeat-containing and planar cell polarity effector protein fritz homolog isoform X1 [Hippocampus zosterae]XP_051936142.1 WD repeat-containing and planar cell polarity effector protein fritz homolog isoform X1 [Hippocampus zosterae]